MRKTVDNAELASRKLNFDFKESTVHLQAPEFFYNLMKAKLTSQQTPVQLAANARVNVGLNNESQQIFHLSDLLKLTNELNELFKKQSNQLDKDLGKKCSLQEIKLEAQRIDFLFFQEQKLSINKFYEAITKNEVLGSGIGRRK